MKIYVDSREKWTHDGSTDTHIRRYLEKHSIEWEVKKLDCGDYMLPCKNVSVDRKQNLDELATNLLNPNDKARFWREVRRARETGIRLIILCEHGGAIRAFRDVKSWRSKYGRVTGKSLSEAIFRLFMAYGVPVLFCDKRSTGRRIIEILNEELDKTDEQAFRTGVE